nr:lactate utilization protein C [uncultured Bacillus sp.]
MPGTVQNRDAFLANIANRLGRERRTNMEVPKWKYNPQEEVYKGASSDELLELFKKHGTGINCEVFVTSKEQAAEVVHHRIKELGGGPIVTWKDSRYEELFGLGQLFKEELPKDKLEVFEWDHALGRENIEKANKANIGITISEITLAESGTIVVFSGKDRGRTVSFLPEYSIVLIPKSSIVPRMTQAAKILREKVKKGEAIPSCINYITGPSKSSDIEMKLVVGVHGPVKVNYIVVEDL